MSPVRVLDDGLTHQVDFPPPAASAQAKSVTRSAAQISVIFLIAMSVSGWT